MCILVAIPPNNGIDSYLAFQLVGKYIQIVAIPPNNGIDSYRVKMIWFGLGYIVAIPPNNGIDSYILKKMSRLRDQGSQSLLIME